MNVGTERIYSTPYSRLFAMIAEGVRHERENYRPPCKQIQALPAAARCHRDMKWFLVLVLAVLLPACKKPAVNVAAVPLRLRVTPDAVFFGERKLAADAEALADYFKRMAEINEVGFDVRLVFARDVRGERMVELLNAVIRGGSHTGTTLHFSIEGHDGEDFRLTLPDNMCCAGRAFEPFCDEWGEGGLAIHQGQRFIEMDVALRDGILTAGGEALEPGEFLTMLIQRHRLIDGMTVQISMDSEDTAGQLLPLLQACQFMDADLNIGAEHRETSEREQRRLANLLRTPRWNPIFDCGIVSPSFSIPNVTATTPSIEWFPTGMTISAEIRHEGNGN
jgi:hypothetical protein